LPTIDCGAALFLVVPGERYRAPPRLETAELRAAYDQGVRDTAARSTAACKPLSFEELDRLEALGREARRAYWLAARREPVRAPPSLAVEAALLALEAVTIIHGSDLHGVRRSLVKRPPLVALAVFTAAARKRAERRRARRLGLSARTAPEPMIDSSLFLLALAVVPCRLHHRQRAGVVEREDWPLMLARTLVARFVARRSWQRAMRPG
jgi:hypothetical protein